VLGVARCSAFAPPLRALKPGLVIAYAASVVVAPAFSTSYPAGYSDRLATDATVSTFDGAGDMTSETTPDPAGQSSPAYQTTTYTYDGNGNVLTTTAPPATNGGSSQVTMDTYNAAGELATETTGYGTPAASTVSYCYDPNGDQTSEVVGDGNTSGTAACSTAYPWAVTASPQAAYQTTYEYDSAGDLVTTISPANTASSAPTTTARRAQAGRRGPGRSSPRVAGRRQALPVRRLHAHRASRRRG
jgi:YD repeat-containing protein